MKKENYQKGKRGEEIAKDYLEQKGWIWIKSNYKNQLGEIDLIMKDDETLVFVEVKLKVGEEFGQPEEMIGWGKRWQIRRVAEAFVALEKPKQSKYRIDGVCIVMELGKIKRINHYENLEN